jgi:hypothetical protein
VSALRVFRRARQAAAAVPVVEVPETGGVLVRVTVQVTKNETGYGSAAHGVKAVAEVSDGRVTARGTAWSGLWTSSPRERVEAARKATEEAVQQARWLLDGAQAGYAAEAEQAAAVDRSAAAAGPVGSGVVLCA